MSRFAIAFAVVVSLPSCVAPAAKDRLPRRDLPEFLSEAEISCARYAEAVNYYVDIGEENAVASLEALAASEATHGDPPDRAQRRMALLCRVLFEPKGKGRLRGPAFGEVHGLPRNTMPRERWPLYPVTQAGSSYFVLGEGYVLGGKAESPASYVDYCRAEGTFRKGRVPVPTRAQALRDFESLRESEPWKALKWKDQGQGFSYQLSETSVLEYLKAQAERIPR